MTRTIVALYEDLSTAQQVVHNLTTSGIPRENISLVASDATGEYSTYLAHPEEGEHVGAAEGSAFGAAVGALTGALVALGALVIPGIGPVIAAGPLAAGLLGAATGAVAGGATGGIVGGLLHMGIPEDEAHYYAEGLRRGGTLVSATVSDDMANRAEAVMNQYNPIDLDRRAAYWREGGWNRFNEAGTPYDYEELERERQSYQDYSAQSPTSPSGSTSTKRTRTYDPTSRV
jgi:hypothetical protein